MYDLPVAMETSFRLQNVEVFEQVDGEGLLQEESLRKGLEGLSARDLKSKMFYKLNCNTATRSVQVSQFKTTNQTEAAALQFSDTSSCPSSALPPLLQAPLQWPDSSAS